MKNQDGVSSPARLSEAKGRAQRPPGIFPPRLGGAEPKTLDMGVRPGGGQGYRRARSTPPHPPGVWEAQACLHVHTRAQRQSLQAVVRAGAAAGSCEAPSVWRPSTRQPPGRAGERAPTPATPPKRAPRAPGAPLTCSPVAVCTSSLIRPTRKATPTGFGSFRIVLLLVLRQRVPGTGVGFGLRDTTGLPGWRPQPGAATGRSASGVARWWPRLGSAQAAQPGSARQRPRRTLACVLGRRLQGLSPKSCCPSNVIFSVNPEEKAGFPSVCWDRVTGWASLMPCYPRWRWPRGSRWLGHGHTRARKSPAPGGRPVAAASLPAAATRINSAAGRGSLKLWVLVVGSKRHRNVASSLLRAEGHAV